MVPLKPSLTQEQSAAGFAQRSLRLVKLPFPKQNFLAFRPLGHIFLIRRRFLHAKLARP